MRLCKVIFFLLLFFFTLQVKTFAQENWEIDSYSTGIKIEESGVVSFEESIDVNFGQQQKHGIYRDIPYEYQTENDKSYYTEVTVNQVLQDGQNAEYELSRENGNLRIKIGDPDKTITGKHNYEIDYKVVGILQGFEDFDEIYWNVIGNNWAVPIYEAEASVMLPRDGIINQTCFVGESGSLETCESEVVTDSEVVFRSPRALLPYEGLTVAVGFEKDMVPLLTAVRPKTLFERFFQWPSIATFLSVTVFAILAVVFIWLRQGRDYWQKNIPHAKDVPGETKPIGGHETIVVEYEPPEKLRPAQLGVLFDEVAHTHDVTSTIVDLATRGYLVITELEKNWKFGKHDYEFTRTKKDTKNLLEYEKLLLSHLFKTGNTVKMSALKQTFYDELLEVKKKLYENVVEEGLFVKDPDKTRNTYLAFSIIGVIFSVSIFILGINLNALPLVDLALGLLIGAIIFVIFSRFMPQRTAKGRELYRRTKGYRLFISKVETHRQRFFEKKNMFNEVLPYAMVFELTDKYIKAMGDLGIEKQTSSWYRGTNAFVLGSFASSMNSFSQSVGTAISSAPKSSGSSSSGGGFSGGGFGGGGGGSW